MAIDLYKTLTGKPSTGSVVYRAITKPTNNISTVNNTTTKKRSRGFSSKDSGFSSSGVNNPTQQELAINELNRINKEKENIKNIGGRTEVQNLREVGTGNRIQTTNTYIDKLVDGVKFKQRVYEVKNLDTGEVRIKTFDYDKRGRKSFQSGGVSYKESKVLNIKPTGKALSSQEILNKSYSQKELKKLVSANKFSAFWNKWVKTPSSVPTEVSTSTINKIEEGLIKQEEYLKNAKTKLAKRFWKKQIRGTNEALLLAKQGRSKLIAGDPPPLIPIYTLPGNTKAVIVGTTKNIGKFQISNLNFRQLGNRGKIKNVGSAKVFSIGKGKKSFSVSVGGIVKKNGKGFRSFIGIEGTAQGVNKQALRSKLLKFVNSDGSVNQIKVIKELNNIKSVRSGSVGELLTMQTKRGRIFPSGKLREVIKIDTTKFVNIAQSFTKKDLSVIVGKTITREQDKTQFLAIIKRLNNPQQLSRYRLSGKELQQYTKAIQKVTGVVAAALSKSRQFTPSKTASIPIATRIIQRAINMNKKGSVPLSTTIRTINPSKLSITQSQLGRIKTITRDLTKAEISRIMVIPKSKLGNKAKTIQKEVQIIKGKIKQIQRITPASKTIQKARQIPILTNKISSLNSQLKLIRTLILIPSIRIIPTRIFFPPVSFKKKIKKIPQKQPQKPKGYNVYVKSKGKFIKVNPLPLSLVDAMDRGAYVVDNSTSANYVIRPLTSVKKLGKITTKEKGASKKKYFREFKVKKKRRINTPRSFIEDKGKPRINTRGEVRGLSASRVASGLNRKRKRNARKRK